MKKNLLNLTLAAIAGLLLTTTAKAQVAAYPYTASLDTFNVITGTTVDMPGVDDVQYGNLNIGFNFNYGGVSHSTFTASTNGYIVLASNASSTFYNPLNGSFNNVISPFGADLMNINGNTASLQYVTLGNAPNRVCVVQWLHYSYYSNGGNLNFQIWMYENSGGIRFVYGANTYISTIHTIQIGLRGTTNLDYTALGDTTCNWANAYPYPSIATHFPVSVSCTQPSGFAFHFGNVSNNGNINFAYITGKVFNDANNNGTLDGGETGIANRIVHIVPGNYYVSSDAIGNYAFYFFDSTLTYTLTCAGPTYWTSTTGANLSVHPQTQSTSGNNFGFHMMPNVHELAIACPNWGAKPGQSEPMPISYHNNGTTIESDTITFVMDALYSFISSTPAPVSVSGQTIKWYYSNLQIGGSGYIYLHLLPSASAVLGNYLNSTLTIKPLATDTVPANNIINLHQLLTNAWDPNEKSVEPAGMIPNNTELNYTIHFQNTGNAAAANISVKDTLDTNVEPMTFRITGSSHPYNFVMSGNGIATFNFYNIQLPDSSSNFAGSNGWISYAITTKPSLPQSTVINNRASIYFDYNLAVLTNTASDTIQMLTTSIARNGITTHVINTYPNPASGTVVFAFSSNTKDKANLTITTIEGKVIMSRNNISPSETIDVSILPSGIYMCSLNSGSHIQYVKLVKE